jgi:phosphomannomutase
VINLSAFKAYDIRGRLPDELNETMACQVGQAYAALIRPKRVVVGRDIRLSSQTLAQAVIDGLRGSGVSVSDIGVCGTEGVYFATSSARDSNGEAFDGGIMVTASHNPPDYNGMKLVREGSRPISADTGLREMAALIRQDALPPLLARNHVAYGSLGVLDTSASYRDHLLQYVDLSRLRRLKVVVNPGNGGAGAFVDLLEPFLPFEFIKVHHEADGRFPNGVPNPMIAENRRSTIDAIRASGADVGLAWDGDFDRCFFFDHTGRFIEGYYLVGLLAEVFLEREPGARVVHDPRLTWNTIDVVKRAGGSPVLCRSGHAFMKQKMREVDAVYGGEMSAHHYFREFAYCDSGMIPWLMVLSRICESGKTLAELVDERIRLFPCSGEINRSVPDGKAAIEAVQDRYRARAVSIDYTDGLSMEFEGWRLNLRSSNTEPLIRLNVESRGREDVMESKTAEILSFLGELGAEDPGH